MRQNWAGIRIRSLRREAGLTQAALAGKAGISPSYLNLIEANRRPVAGALLDRIATELDVDRTLLDGRAENRIVEALDEIAADPAIAVAPRPGGAEKLVSNHPDWAGYIQRLYRGFREQSETVTALADRLNRDPFLGDSVHRMLSSVTAIHSAAEILQGADRLSPADRQRFLSIVSSDSERLARTAKSLVEFIESTQVRMRSVTPVEAVDAFLLESDNHFPAIEALAEEFRHESRGHESVEDAAAMAVNRAGGKMPEIDPFAPAQSRRFALLRHWAGVCGRDVIDGILDAHDSLSPETRQLCALALRNYAAGAVAMPYGPFLEAAETWRYDIDRLIHRFGVSHEQAAHRLSTLRRPGQSGVRFAFMRSDASGFVSKRLPLANLPLPRYSTACPLWAIHGAFQSPGVTVAHFGQLPSGDRFLFFARAIDKIPAVAGRPRRLLSVMLACHGDEAGRVIYGDGLQHEQATLPVGTVCRLCSRADCRHRQEEPLVL